MKLPVIENPSDDWLVEYYTNQQFISMRFHDQYGKIDLVETYLDTFPRKHKKRSLNLYVVYVHRDPQGRAACPANRIGFLPIIQGSKVSRAFPSYSVLNCFWSLQVLYALCTRMNGKIKHVSNKLELIATIRSPDLENTMKLFAYMALMFPDITNRMKSQSMSYPSSLLGEMIASMVGLE